MMNSPVKPGTLRFLYFLFGGLPALLLGVLCVYLVVVGVVRALDREDLDLASISQSFVMPALGIVGAASGWLTLLGVGTASSIGRALHVCGITGGVAAAVFAMWAFDPIVTLFALGPCIVGVCLLFHLRAAAQPGAPADAPRPTGSGFPRFARRG